MFRKFMNMYLHQAISDDQYSDYSRQCDAMIKEAYQFDSELDRLSNNLGGLDKYKEMGNLEKRKQDEAAYRRLGCDWNDIDKILKGIQNEASHAFMNPRSKPIQRRNTAD